MWLRSDCHLIFQLHHLEPTNRDLLEVWMISFVPWISNWASNYKLYWLISDPTESRKPLLPEKLLTNFTRNLSPFHSGRLACFYWQGRTKESNWNIGMDLWQDMTYVLIYEILCLYLTERHHGKTWHIMRKYYIDIYPCMNIEHEVIIWKLSMSLQCCDSVLGVWWILFFQYCSESRWPGLNKYFKRDHQCFCSEKPGNVEIDCKIKFKTFSSSNKDIERMFF